MASNMTRKQIVMAMSGGVDSSVAAYLLNHQIDTSIHSVMGLHMNNWNTADEDPSRSGGNTSNAFCVQSEQDANDAEGICDMFGMNWGSSSDSHSINPLLLSGADGRKDQSYFLCGVKGDAFSNVLFPLGDLIKDKSSSTSTSVYSDHEDPARTGIPVGINDDVNLNTMSVREIASLSGLPTASKKDSMGICFIGKRKFPAFISEYLPPNESLSRNFIDIDTGEIVGTYNDSSHFTIGQGAKISGASQKWFVTKKDDAGTVFVCSDTHHPSLYSDELLVREEDLNWIGGELPQPLLNEGNSLSAMCRTRHLQPLVPCQVSRFGSFVRVKFDRPVRALTPGQTAAIYVGRGLICLGGGQIWKHGDTYQDLGLDLPSNLHPSGSNDLSIIRRNEST